MVEQDRLLENKLRELEVVLEEEKSISKARNTLLEANIRELNDIYGVLNEKLMALRSKEERIKSFEAELVKAHKLSSLGELAGSIAHEIKNPLVSIQGFAKRIGKTKDADKIEQYAKLIEKEAERLATVLMKLLDFSRMDDPKKEQVDIREIVDIPFYYGTSSHPLQKCGC
jgi:C4-dicarboxylate-specific signal transduction histidine kinase